MDSIHSNTCPGHEAANAPAPLCRVMELLGAACKPGERTVRRERGSSCAVACTIPEAIEVQIRRTNDGKYGSRSTAFELVIAQVNSQVCKPDGEENAPKTTATVNLWHNGKRWRLTGSVDSSTGHVMWETVRGKLPRHVAIGLPDVDLDTTVAVTPVRDSAQPLEGIGCIDAPDGYQRLNEQIGVAGAIKAANMQLHDIAVELAEPRGYGHR